MTAFQLRIFVHVAEISASFRKLLEKFFTDSDKMRGTPATASETDVKGTERNIARNAEKLLGKMREILARRLLV